MHSSNTLPSKDTSSTRLGYSDNVQRNAAAFTGLLSKDHVDLAACKGANASTVLKLAVP